MKTEELIRVLAADGARPVVPVSRTLWRALGLGVSASAGLLLLLLHPRADLPRALFTLRFDFKLVFALLVAAAAMMFLRQAARPFAPERWRWPLVLGPVFLLTGVVLELWRQPATAWGGLLIGHNAVHCLSLIPMLSLPLVVCLFVALRRAAPMKPIVAGATAGLVAGGVGAMLYALTCPDDSPLFVATWYPMAMAVVTGAAAWVGRRLLRW
jgi:hypothetical protein